MLPLLLLAAACLLPAPGFAQNDELIKAMKRAREEMPSAPAPRKGEGHYRDSLIAGIDEALRAGRNFLESNQREDGGWSEPRDDPFRRVGLTVLALEALEKAGLALDAPGMKRGGRFVLETGFLDERRLEKEFAKSRSGNNNRPYALAFGLMYAARFPGLKRPSDGKPYAELFSAEVEKLVKEDKLNYVQGEAGSASFQLALLLAGLARAKAPAELQAKVAERLEKLRRTDRTFAYSEGTEALDDAAGAASRGLACETALYEAGRGSKKDLLLAVDRFIGRHDEMARLAAEGGPGHQGKHLWAKYYYLFGVYWFSNALELAAADDPQGYYLGYSQLMIEKVLSARDNDRWVDAASVVGPNYGTATAMAALANLRRLNTVHYKK